MTISDDVLFQPTSPTPGVRETADAISISRKRKRQDETQGEPSGPIFRIEVRFSTVHKYDLVLPQYSHIHTTLPKHNDLSTSYAHYHARSYRLPTLTLLVDRRVPLKDTSEISSIHERMKDRQALRCSSHER